MTLIVSNIRHPDDGEVTSTKSLTKAWSNFNGTGTIALNESLNISSISDRGTGSYYNNLTNSLSTTTCVSFSDCATAVPILSTNGNRATISDVNSVSQISVNSFEAAAGSLIDIVQITMSVTGELA